jgi:hypothetical protein
MVWRGFAVLLTKAQMVMSAEDAQLLEMSAKMGGPTGVAS